MSEADALASVASERAVDTMAHAERVGRFALSVARTLGIGDTELALIEAAARFHDVGKAAMPEALITKPSPLTPGEAAIMRRHVDVGAELLLSTESLSAVAPLVLGSHEWFNGGGYPRKLAGDAIPIGSRIIAVTDAYDAMTQDRHYRTRLDSADAIAELLRCAAIQFDPTVVDAFLRVLSRH
jgi:putative nucleotidyltransferase with HDIG domain